eukprot:scaffold6147_cov126-Amphora_coffeaeformis.AAC.4
MFFTSKELVIPPEDYRQWIKEALVTKDPLEAEHLFAPGTVYLMYESWGENRSRRGRGRILPRARMRRHV